MANLLQLKVTIRHTRPPVWRRVSLPDTLTLHELHFALQMLFDWEDYHLYEFVQRRPGQPNFRAMPGPDEMDGFVEEQVREPAEVLLSQLLTAVGSRLDYIYDFGDYWEHELVVEEVTPLLPGHPLPAVRCLAGKRAAPPEDIGGIPGYEQLLELLAEKAAGKRKRMPDGYGGLGKFDPAECELERYNHNLALLSEIVADANEPLTATDAFETGAALISFLSGLDIEPDPEKPAAKKSSKSNK